MEMWCLSNRQIEQSEPSMGNRDGTVVLAPHGGGGATKGMVS